MAEYINDLGEIYTEDEINQFAQDEDTTFDHVIQTNGLKPSEDPGKKGVVAKKDAKTTTKNTASSSASASSVSQKPTKGLYPWSYRALTPEMQTNKKLEEQTKEQKKQKQLKINETGENLKASLVKSQNDLAVQMGGTPIPVPPTKPLLMTSEAWEQEKAQNEALKKQQEEQKNLDYAKGDIRSKEARIRTDKTYQEASDLLKTADILPKDFSEELDRDIKGKLEVDGKEYTYYPSYGGAGVSAQSTPVIKKYNSFEEEKKQAIKEFKKANRTATPEQILQRAAEIYKNNKSEEKLYSQKWDALENLESYGKDVQKFFIDYDVSKKAVAANNLAKTTTQKSYTEKAIEHSVSQIKDLEKQLKPIDYKYTTQEEVDAQNEIINQINDQKKEIGANAKYYDKLTERQEDYTNQSVSLDKNIELQKKDWNWWSRTGRKIWNSYVNEFGGSIAGALAYTDDLLMDTVTFGSWGNKIGENVAETRKTNEENYNSKMAAPRGAFTSPEAFMERAAGALIDQLPIIVTMAVAPETYAPELVGFATGAVTGTGSKYTQMLQEQKYGIVDDEGQVTKPSYNTAQLFGVPALFGAFEGGTEYVGGRAFGRMKKMFSTATPAELSQLLGGAEKSIAKTAANFSKELLHNYGEEVPSEVVNTLLGNVTDKILLGKDDVNVLDNVGDTIFDTMVVSTLFATSPHIAGLAYKPFISSSNITKLQENNNKIAGILKGIDYEKLSIDEKVIIDSKIQALKDSSTEIINNTIGLVGNTNTDDLLSINNLSKKVVDIKKQAQVINNSANLTDVQKKDMLAELNNEYTATNAEYNRYLGAAQRQETAQKKANTFFNRLKLNKDINLGEEFNAKVLVNNSNAKFEYGTGKELVAMAMKDPAYQEKITKLADAIENEEVASGGDKYSAEQKLFTKRAVASQIVNSNGLYDAANNTIYVNKDKALSSKLFTTARHEFFHKIGENFANNMGNIGKTLYTFVKEQHIGKTEFGKTSFAKRMDMEFSDAADEITNANEDQANQISNLKELKNNGKITESQFRSQSNKIKRTFDAIRKDIDNRANEEVSTILAESLESGDIKIDKIHSEKVKLDEEGNVVLNNAKDVFNFIAAYNESFSKTQESEAVSAAVQGKVAGELITEKPTTTKTEGAKKSKAKSELLKEELDTLEDNEGDYDPYDYDQRVASLKAQIKRAIEKEKTETKPEVKKEVSQEDEVKQIIDSEKGSISSDKVQNIYNEKGFDGAYEIIKLFRPITNKIVNKRKDAPGFDEELLRDEIETSDLGILGMIKKYDAGKGIPLAAYINKYLPVRAIAISRNLLDNDFKKDVTEEKGLMAEETVSEAKEKPKYKNALESKVFEPEVLKTMSDKIITQLRTLKSRIDEPISLNRTVTPLIAEIRDAIGKQLDIDVKTAMGGKKDGQLVNWLLKNKRYVLENMTTTWLMGANGQGGIPQAIQKRIDGKWVNYPEWVDKKIDREAVSTDNAGRTSGAELVRRLPNAVNNISDTEYLGQVVSPDGNPIRGRKESLAKVVAEESAFDIINDDLQNDGPIYDALKTNQERQGLVVAENFSNEFIRQSERGNVKYSKALRLELSEKLGEDLDDKGVTNIIRGIIGQIIKPTIYKRKIALNDLEQDWKERLGNDLYEKVYDEYLTPIADALDTVQNSPSNKRGNVAEDNVIATIKSIDNKDFKLMLVKSAGAGSHAIDVQFSYKGLSINFEVKSGKADRLTSLNIHNYTNKGITTSRVVSEDNKNSITSQIQDNSGFQKFVRKALDNGATLTENGSLEVDQKLLNKLKAGGSIYGKTLIPLNIDINLIKDIYNRKGINYIGFGDIGIFSVGENILGLDVPNLEGKLYSKAFLHPGIVKVNGKVTLTLKVYTQLTTEASNQLSEKSKDSVYSKESWNNLFKDIPESRISYIKSIPSIKENNNTSNATLNSLSNAKKSKGISVFDFDDTVGLTKSNVLYTMPGDIMVYHGAPKGKDVTKISDKGVKFFATDRREADEYARMHSGTTQQFVLSNSQIIDEEIAINKMRELGLTPKNKEFELDDASFYELIDPRFEESLSKSDIEKLFNALKKDGVKALSYTDGAQVSGKLTTSIAVIDPSIISMPRKLNGAEFAKEGSRLLEEGATFNFSEFSKVVEGKPGPMVEKMKKMIGKFGSENFFILTARPANSALPIKEFLDSIDINIPLENITGLGNSSPQAKADWIVQKANDGYNDFYFADDHLPNVTAVKDALNVLDVKSKIQQAKAKLSKSMNDEFNKIIEENTGTERFKVFSDIVARRRGAKKNRFDFYVPPSAADFELLLYKFIGKGSIGEQQKKFFSDTLLKPYANGNDLMDAARQSIKRNYKALIDSFPDISKKLESLTPDKDFTYDQAIRVAIWNESGVEIPGISKRDIFKLTKLVNEDPQLGAFKDGLIITGRQGKGWVNPEEHWDANTIISDLHNLTEGVGRKKFLGEFIENVENIFGKWDNGKLIGPNMNKVEALYGTKVREALEDIIYRMTTGKNKSFAKDKETTMWSNWVNGSTGTIMFLNTRSAALQLIGAINFLNFRDNNPISAAAAFANQPQYWKDFAFIWNSDKMKERRGGLKEDVAAAEIANAAAGSKNKVNAVVSYLLKIGYTPTQLADSFAIASGGAPYYRNRIKSYLKEGYNQEQAETAAWEDFSKVSDETQQSGDPRDISKQQASPAGRLLLTFQNTAMQQSRIVKKAFLDIKNRRGDDKTNISKIIYYLTIQNLLFAALQQGLFAVAFDDDDDEEKDPEKEKAKKKTTNEKLVSVADDVLDTILRGTGFAGGVTATLKNMILKYIEESDKKQADYAKVVFEGTNISPPIGSKLKKLYSGLNQTKYDKDLIKERGWGVMQDGRVHLGPMYSVSGKVVEATTNLPMDRLINKIENVSQAMNSQNQAWQRVMVGMGWSPYSVGIEGTPGDTKIKEAAKVIRKEEGKIKAEETRQRKKDSIRNLPFEERLKYRRKIHAEYKEKRKKKREKRIAELKKREMGGE